MSVKTGYHHGDLRRALLDGAVAEVAAHGVGAFSLSALARACNVSTAAPYRHFADRDALFAEVALEGYERLAHRLAGRAAGADAPAEVVLAMGLAYLEFAEAEPGYFAVMFGGVVEKDRFPAVRAAGDAALGAVVAAVGAVGGTPADALSFWALAHGFAILGREGLWRETPGAPPIGEAMRAAGQALLVGIERGGR